MCPHFGADTFHDMAQALKSFIIIYHFYNFFLFKKNQKKKRLGRVGYLGFKGFHYREFYLFYEQGQRHLHDIFLQENDCKGVLFANKDDTRSDIDEYLRFQTGENYIWYNELMIMRSLWSLSMNKQSSFMSIHGLTLKANSSSGFTTCTLNCPKKKKKKGVHLKLTSTKPDKNKNKHRRWTERDLYKTNRTERESDIN